MDYKSLKRHDAVAVNAVMEKTAVSKSLISILYITFISYCLLPITVCLFICYVLLMIPI